MFLNKLGMEMIGGCHAHDDIQLLSSDSSRKANEASRNEFKLCKHCNASTNPILTVKLVDNNLVQCF